MKKLLLSLIVAVTMIALELTSVSANTITYYANFNPSLDNFESTPRGSVSLSNADKLHKTATITAGNNSGGIAAFEGNYAYQVRTGVVEKVDLSLKMVVWETTINNVSFDPILYYSGRGYVANNIDNNLYVLDANSGYIIKKIPTDGIMELNAANGRILVWMPGDIRLYNTTSFTQVGGDIKLLTYNTIMNKTSLYLLAYNNIVHIYSTATGKQQCQFSPKTTVPDTLSLYNNTLIVEADSKVQGYSTTGKLLWTHTTPYTFTAEVVEKGRLYLMSTSNRLLAINVSNGNSIFDVATTSLGLDGRNLIASNGILYVYNGLTVRMVNMANGKFLSNKLTVSAKISNDMIIEVVPLGSNTIAVMNAWTAQITLFSV